MIMMKIQNVKYNNENKLNLVIYLSFFKYAKTHWVWFGRTEQSQNNARNACNMWGPNHKNHSTFLPMNTKNCKKR
jgi:hypothetical protein